MFILSGKSRQSDSESAASEEEEEDEGSSLGEGSGGKVGESDVGENQDDLSDMVEASESDNNSDGDMKQITR